MSRAKDPWHPRRMGIVDLGMSDGALSPEFGTLAP